MLIYRCLVETKLLLQACTSTFAVIHEKWMLHNTSLDLIYVCSVNKFVETHLHVWFWGILDKTNYNNQFSERTGYPLKCLCESANISVTSCFHFFMPNILECNKVLNPSHLMHHLHTGNIWKTWLELTSTCPTWRYMLTSMPFVYFFWRLSINLILKEAISKY